MKKKDRQKNKERDRQLSWFTNRFTDRNRDGLKPAGRHNRQRKKDKDRDA